MSAKYSLYKLEQVHQLYLGYSVFQKTNKPYVPKSPIVNMSGYPYCLIEKLIATILEPIRGGLATQSLGDTFHLVDAVENVMQDSKQMY